MKLSVNWYNLAGCLSEFQKTSTEAPFHVVVSCINLELCRFYCLYVFRIILEFRIHACCKNRMLGIEEHGNGNLSSTTFLNIVVCKNYILPSNVIQLVLLIYYEGIFVIKQKPSVADLILHVFTGNVCGPPVPFWLPMVKKSHVQARRE